MSFFGKVQDSAGKHEPLPFVKIVIKKQKVTRVADIDGNWSLNDIDKQDTIIFSYMGYKTMRVPIAKLVFGNENIVYMDELPHTGNEVVIFPGVNPAERISVRS